MVAATKRVVRQKAKGPIDPAFGKRLRQLRHARGMTQADVAGDDFTKAFISLIETGRTRVSVRAAEIIARKLGVTFSELFGEAAGSDARLELSLLQAEQALVAGRHADAIALAEAGAEKSSDVLRARFQRVWARALIESARSPDAVRLLDEALRVFRARGLRDLEARTLFDLARAHARLDAPGEALSFAQAVERAISDGAVIDRTLELDVQRFIANVYVRTGDVGSAAVRAERALAIAEDVADPAALAKLYGGLAQTRAEQEDHEAALAYARRSLDLLERLHQETAVAETWNTVAWVYVQRKQFGRASEALDRAEELARGRGNERLLAWTTATRAELALARGKHAEAAALAEQSAKHPHAPPAARASALLIRAQALAGGRTASRRVRAAFEAAIKAHEGQPARMRAKVHQAYGEALAGRGQAKVAFAEAEKALGLLQRG